MNAKDIHYMKRAIKISKINAGKTAPNPWVGAVLVKDDRIIGEGFHLGAGFPHAEVEAINSAKRRGFSTEGAIMYVSLQPCNTQGRTPPCTDAIRSAGIRKVFFSVYDPAIDQRSYRVSGYEIEGGVLKDEGERVLLPYLTYVESKRPYVIVKLAQTLDGRIADHKGESKYITSQKSLEVVHMLRTRSNAVIIGEETLVKDNPFLNTRKVPESFLRKLRKVSKMIQGDYPSPVKVVIDSDLSSFYHRGFNLEQGNNTVFICSSERFGAVDVESRSSRDLPKNFSFVSLRSGSQLIDPWKVLEFLHELGIMVVVVEGGARTAWEFIRNDAFDELWIFISPKILGGGKVLGNRDRFELGMAKKLKLSSVRRIEDDILIILTKGERAWDVF